MATERNVGVHPNILNDLQVILFDLRGRVLYQLSKKLGLDYDELFERYCVRPVRIIPTDTVTNLTIAEFSPDIYECPPGVPKSRARHVRKAHPNPKKPVPLPEQLKATIEDFVQRLRKENDEMEPIVHERLKNIEEFSLEESKIMLEHHQDILKEAVASGFLSSRQAYNSFRRDMMNLLRGTDPDRAKRTRDADDVHSYFEMCLHRLETAMTQNALKTIKI
jgi:polyhydroxyalkanoate synthesis regulator phasin